MKYVTIARFNPGKVRKYLSKDIPDNFSLVKQARTLEKVLNSPPGIKIYCDKNDTLKDVLWKKVFKDVKLSDSYIPILKTNFSKIIDGFDSHWDKEPIGDKTAFVRV